MENSRTCEICNVNVHRASMQKHLRSKKHLENIERNEMIIPEWFFKEEKSPIKKKIQKVYNPKTLKQLAREKIKLDDKQLAKIMINPYYFIDKNLKIGFKINLESHNIGHANSILTITPKFPEFGIEFRYINKIVKELSVIYARLINQYKFKYHTLFSASFYKINEEDQRNNEIELYINLKINHNLTESDIDNIDVRSQLEQQIQNQEMKESGWIFNKINSMKISFYKTTELNGTSYVKIPLGSSAILKIQNNDKYCFIWSILASLHPCENTHPSRVNNYLQYFNELNFQSFDFTNGFKCSDVHRFNELNNLSVNIYELNFYQDGDKWKHNLIPIEISKNGSDKIVDLLIYKNYYALIKKIHVFLGDHNKSFVCRRCLNSYTCEKWHGDPNKYWNWLEEILNTPDDGEFGYFLEVDLKYPDNIKQKTKFFPFCPENKKIDPNKYNEYMNSIKPENYTKSKKLICDWTDKKNYLVHYRMLKFYVRHGMVVEKIHEIISFKQSKWLESYISVNTQKRNKAKNDFEKDFFKLLVNAAFGKFLENIRNRLELELIKKDDIKKIITRQSKLTFNGIQKSYENYDSYTFKQNQVVMDKAIYVGFSILELSKLHMYETYYDTLQPYFGQENLQLHYIDTDGMFLSMKTKDIIKDLKNLEDIFDFSNLDKNHKLYSEKNKKRLGFFKLETALNIWIDEFVCLRSKAYSFKCKNNDENKNKIKGIS